MHTATRHAAAHPLVSSRQIGDRLRARPTAIATAIIAIMGMADNLPFVSPASAQGNAASVARAADPFTAFVAEASPAVRDSRVVDPRRHACRERGRYPRPLSERRDGPDADHAGDMGEPSRSSRPGPQSLRSARQYSGGCGLSPRAARSLRIARISSPPTMPDRDGMRTIWRQADRSRTKRAPMSPRSHR